MTDQELRDLVAETSKLVLQNSQAIEKLREENDKTARTVRQTNKQLGELGRKWGGYTEGLAEESLKEIFRKKFKLEFSAKNVRRSKGGKNIELDMLGYSNSTENIVFVAEIKSHFSDEDFEQVLEMLEAFPKFFPEHADKKLYGIVAAVQIPENLRNKLAKKGIYLAVLGGEVFKLNTPKKFQPKQYNPKIKTKNEI